MGSSSNKETYEGKVITSKYYIKYTHRQAANTDIEVMYFNVYSVRLTQEYDYVFSVDVEEGKPHKKLPYNLSGKVIATR